MSTIEERIKKHEEAYNKAAKLMDIYSSRVRKQSDKMTFHGNAIVNLKKKQKVN